MAESRRGRREPGQRVAECFRRLAQDRCADDRCAGDEPVPVESPVGAIAIRIGHERGLQDPAVIAIGNAAIGVSSTGRHLVLLRVFDQPEPALSRPIVPARDGIALQLAPPL